MYVMHTFTHTDTKDRGKYTFKVSASPVWEQSWHFGLCSRKALRQRALRRFRLQRDSIQYACLRAQRCICMWTHCKSQSCKICKVWKRRSNGNIHKSFYNNGNSFVFGLLGQPGRTGTFLLHPPATVAPNLHSRWAICWYSWERKKEKQTHSLSD